MVMIFTKEAKTSEGKCNHLLPGSSESRCHRCNGLLVPEYTSDFQGAPGGEVLARRCVQCGEVIDPIILRNRHLQRKRGGVLTTEQQMVSMGHCI